MGRSTPNGCPVPCAAAVGDSSARGARVGRPLAHGWGMTTTLVALEPDADRWQELRPRLASIGMPGVAVDGVRGVESVIANFGIDAALIRPVGDIDDHRRLVAMLRDEGTRVYVTAEISQPQILALYYGLGDQTRTVRPDPALLVDDILLHARQNVDLLPPIPEFGQVSGVANEAPRLCRLEITERDPVRPEVVADRVAPGAIDWIRLPAASA